GEMLAIIPVSIANALFFHRFAHLVDMRKAHAAAALLFVFFGVDTILTITTGISVWETIVASGGATIEWLLGVVQERIASTGSSLAAFQAG
ncbi:MAG: hypothetical protein ACOCYZ_03720, partial [Halococcoides sp.]